MTILESIMGKIVGAAEKLLEPSEMQSHAAAPSIASGTTAAVTPSMVAPAASSTGAEPGQAMTAASQPVDVEAVLSRLSSGANSGGNWRNSIVDLLKLLNLDSSLSARTALANEVGVHVGADGSAEENMALHRAVMRKLAENGGKVPADLSA